jgi:hypothetical protein
LAAIGVTFLALSMLSSVLFVLDVVLNLTASIIMTTVLGGTILVVWWVLPARHKTRSADR